MAIKGFQGTSLLDFPGRLASLVFFGGCNLRCPFCHNPDLVLNPEGYPDLSEEDLLADLRRRSGFIDGVVVTGGEPTLVPNLMAFLRAIKDMGLQVKLDSNGLRPEVLEQALEEGLLDYVAVDLKTAPERYRELHSAPVNVAGLEKTVALLRASDVEYEFRTTCVPGLVEEGDIRAIGPFIAGAQHWVLQQFVPHHALNPALHDLEPHPADKVRAFAELARPWADQVSTRGL